jgi:erythromycin esterase
VTTKPLTVPVRLSDEAVIPLRTLDPTGPLDDLEWLDQAIGDSRVVAIGESAHYNRESYLLRHRLLRYLVERHGFSAYALESGFIEGWLTDGWVRRSQDSAGDAEPLSDVMANGMTSLMGLWTQMRAHLAWMRQHNRTASHPVGFYGIDLPGSMVSLLPGVDALMAYLEAADPDFRVDPSIRETASAFAATSALSAPATISAYGKLAPERRDALTAGLADLTARMTARRLDYVGRTTVDAYDRALRSLSITITLDAMARELARGSYHGMMLDRDVAIADTVEWILRREDRIVVGAHNAHVQRWPATMSGMPPVATMGMHLADRLGKDYLVVGMTSATGQTLNTAPDFYAGKLFTEMEETPRRGSLDALMAASHDGSFATDLRRLSPADAATVEAVSQQRYGALYSNVSPLDAFDVIVHLADVTPAEPDRGALARAPRDVQEAFSQWKPE